MTQILRENQIGSEIFEEVGIDGIETLAARYELANLRVDVGSGGVFFDARLNDDLFRAGGRWEIAFVTDTDDVVTYIGVTKMV